LLTSREPFLLAHWCFLRSTELRKKKQCKYIEHALLYTTETDCYLETDTDCCSAHHCCLLNTDQ
jgi:hypothetical protein